VTCAGTNGLAVTHSVVIGEGITTSWAVFAPRAVVQGRTTAGTTNYLSTQVQHIYNNGASAAGTVWNISDVPALGRMAALR